MASSAEIVYGVILLLSVPLGHLIKTNVNPRKRKFISTTIGVITVALVCRADIIHSLITILVNSFIVCFLKPSVCHIVSFIWCFGYLTFFRTCHVFGFSPVLPHSNAIQLILTLKMIGIAMEVNDTWLVKKAREKDESDEKLKLKEKYQGVSPNILDIFLYAYCYIGILTGPYYKYRTYHDMINESNSSNINTLQPLLNKLKWVPLYGLGFILASKYFQIQYTTTDEFYEQPFWFRLLYMMPMFFIFRQRFYVAWYLSESMCITAGLGAYPAVSKTRIGNGPTDLEKLEKSNTLAPEGIAYDFETIRNIDVNGCEFAPTVREGIRSWNMTVQSWMATNIYKRLTIKSGPMKVAITMGVSAFWHGIHPGYYLSFLTVPLCMVAEEAMTKAFKDNKSPTQQLAFDWWSWFWKMRFFDYMCMSFLLLTFSATIRYWSSIYFSGHILAVSFILIGTWFQPPKNTKENDEHSIKKSK